MNTKTKHNPMDDCLTLPVGGRVNFDKQAIQQAIEIALARRLGSQPINIRRADGSPTQNALREQAAFIAGAGAALQAVFGKDDTLLTDYFPPRWVIATMRGELI